METKCEVAFHPPKEVAEPHPLARRPVDTDDVNDTLIKLMEQENISEGERAFRVHRCRTAKVLFELGKGTAIGKINKLLGWVRSFNTIGCPFGIPQTSVTCVGTGGPGHEVYVCTSTACGMNCFDKD
jgi:hypothetical protein